jgi:hypothetical protein
MDPGNISAIISAVAGLAGVGTGAFLTYLKEKRAERIRDDRDGSYLAILVVSTLTVSQTGVGMSRLTMGPPRVVPPGTTVSITRQR